MRPALIALVAGTIAGSIAGTAVVRSHSGGEADAGASASTARLAAVRASPVPAAGKGRVVLSAGDVGRAVAAGLLPPGTHSILTVGSALHYGDFTWNEAGARDGAAIVTVDLRRQLLSVFRGGDEIGTAVILYGTDGHPTPLGSFPIRAKERDHRSTHYDADMPYALWLTGDGIAVHGSDVRWGRATHGCVGVPPAFAARLFDAVKVGDPVRITSSPAT